MAYDTDLFVIGAGSGGVRAARMSAAMGARVMIAEEFRVGGTCVIRGCVPKKLLVYASEFSHTFKMARGYGWTLGAATLDWPTLRANVAAEVASLSGIYSRNLANSGVEVLAQRATLVDGHAVRLADGRTITAGHILIATGARPWLPDDVPGIEHCITSNEVFNLDRLPKSVVIAGGGYIAVEFAGIFRGLGCEVTLVYRGDTVLRGFDDDVRVQVQGDLQRRGVRVITNAVFTRVDKTKAGLTVGLSTGQTLQAETVMACMGRIAAVDGLGCEAAGVALDPVSRAVVVDAYSRTSVDSVYAVGDVTDRVNLTPVAIREGAAFAQTVFGGTPTAYDHDHIPTAVFTQPAVGVVGLAERDARRKYGQIDVYKTSFRPMVYRLPGDEQRMLMKLVVRASDDVVVGCHIVGPDAPEIIQIVGVAVKAGLTKAQFDATCAVHPSVAEELVTMKEKEPSPTLVRGVTA